MKIMNNEPKKPMKAGIERPRASVVPLGRTILGTEFPGTSSLANFRGRFATLPVRDADVGRGGKADARKREKVVRNSGFFPDRGQFSHLFPGFPGISHLFPHRFFCVMNMKIRPTPLPPPTSVEGGDVCWTALPRASLADSLCPGLHIGRPYGAAMCRAAHGRSDLCVTKFGLFRDVTRKSTKVRTDQGRGYAMLRIVTGRTLFLIMKPGNEEDRNGKERRPTTDKRMNTDSEKTLNRRKQRERRWDAG